ncbi:C40 family peptidase [Ruminiclostridium herbifermentans]|uniref:C40 family peptidase n=1 Tax=Ruminiclostridium herbifermentans TaxID=2488810 RepID=A0A4U7JFE4_9FIRM|nr:C40 family peptidase [Ruminiclostridium herbifermentans]QNU67487.1 C40 family peptidase [Ruminiclostridium herbifermentans]
MNKKLLSTTLALSICAIAIAPIYKHLDINANTIKNVSATSELKQLESEKLLLKKQLLNAKDKVISTENDVKAAIAEDKTKTQTKANDNKTIENKTTDNKSSLNTKTSNTTTKTTLSKPKSKTSTNKTVSSSTKTSKSTTSKSTSSTTSSKTTATTNKSTTTNRGTTSTATSSKVSAIISTAKSFIGVPYVWGGTTASGFDCSGYIQYVLSKNGISVPRTAAEQYKVGTSVSKSNLRVGDLVFFTTYKEGPSHLGFYLGDGNFIHASSSKGVTISSLNSNYYSSRYIGAKRVIN